MGHASKSYLQALGLPFPKESWETCSRSKITKKKLPKSGYSLMSQAPLDLILSDVCGPTASLGGSLYYVSFIDHYTNYSAVYFIKNNSEVPNKFKIFKNGPKTLTNETLNGFSDGGGEYISKQFIKYSEDAGIKKHIHRPKRLNTMAKRSVNRTLPTYVPPGKFCKLKKTLYGLKQSNRVYSTLSYYYYK